MNPTNNSNTLPRMVLGNLSNTEPNITFPSLNKTNSGFGPSSFKNNFSDQSPFSKTTTKTVINPFLSNDPENYHPKANAFSQELPSKSVTSKTFNDNFGYFEDQRSPDLMKIKKPSLRFQAVTPQQRTNDMQRQEKKRLSHGIPRENKFGASYVLDDKAIVGDEDVHIQIKDLTKKINFTQDFITFDTEWGLDNSSKNFNQYQEYDQFLSSPCGINLSTYLISIL